MENDDLLSRLVKINVFNLGNFKLKSGAMSPIYIDLRSIISHPDLVGDIAKAIQSKQNKLNLKVDVACGVPYTALPIASLYSFFTKTPMIMKRKEAKNYGTKKMVEGVTHTGVSCLIIEDIVTSGLSVIETAEVIRKEDLIVTDCVVVLNRMQGGTENLSKAGIKLHSLFTIKDFFDRYCEMNKVDASLVAQVKHYLENNSYIPIVQCPKKLFLPFTERAKACEHPVLKELFHIMATKQSNLCVAVDKLKSSELLDMAEKLGPFICLLKTHIDILDDFNEVIISKLVAISKKYNFLLFEDRKFSDIGNTVLNQYANSIYKIQSWAHIVTVHGLPGSGILQAMSKVSNEKNACVMVAEMSSIGSLTDEQYKDNIAKMAGEYNNFVIGFVSQSMISENQNIIHMSPGVGIGASGDSLGQQYRSPEEAIASAADIVIVGRGICSAADPVSIAALIKKRAYEAYVKECM